MPDLETLPAETIPDVDARPETDEPLVAPAARISQSRSSLLRSLMPSWVPEVYRCMSEGVMPKR